MGLTPPEWTPGMRAWLDAHRPRIAAERLLEQIDTGQAEVGPDAVYNIVLKATGNKRLADAYRIAIIKSRQRPPQDDPME